MNPRAACLLLGTLVSLWAPPPAQAAAAAGANDFLGSMGVASHITQGVDSPGMVAACLTYCGLRNLRDDGTIKESVWEKFIQIHRLTGAKICLMPANVHIPDCLRQYEKLAAAGALLAAEGPNEPNNWPVTYNGQKSGNGLFSTYRPVAEFQRDLYQAVKGDPMLAGIPVFASSEAGGSEADNVGLQFLKIPAGAGTLMPEGTVYADFANAHNYVSGHLKSLQNNAAWDAEDPTLNGPWDGLYVEYGHTWHRGFSGYPERQLENLPRVTTETGWATRGDKAVTESVQGRLFLDLYLSAFKRGWTYTFIYMLHDDPVQGYWGLFHTDYTPKLSAIYIHNLSAILHDPDPGHAAPGSLDYAIPNEPATVHDLLLEKGDGTFELAVWDENFTGADDVTVTLGAPRASIKIYDPTAGKAALQSLEHARSVPLRLTDHPVIIEIPAT